MTLALTDARIDKSGKPQYHQDMNAMEQQKQVIEESRELLISEPGVKLALIFGSYASGKFQPGSDVDIAVFFDRPLDVGRRMALAGRLESKLGRAVDLVDIHAISGTILRQILFKGRVLVKKDPMAMAALIGRMIYNQSDVMPLVRRTLEERQKRFVHG